MTASDVSQTLPLADPAAPLDSIHHVAIAVKNVAEAVVWYRKHFRCEISYQDDTWALLEFDNTRLGARDSGAASSAYWFYSPQSGTIWSIKGPS